MDNIYSELSSDCEEFDTVSVRVVWVENLGFADLLQGSTCSKNKLDGHLIKYLVAVARVISKVKDSLDTADAARVISPLVDGICDLLQGAPVYKDALSTFRSEISEFVNFHPVAYFFEVVHGESSIDAWILADGTSVELSKTDLIFTLVLAESQD